MTGGELITLYADILFLINFSMDFLSLILAAKITGRRLRTRRAALACTVSSLLSCAVTILTPPDKTLHPIARVGLGFLLSSLMLSLSCGRYEKIICLLRESVILWGIGAFLGGLVTFITNLTPALGTHSVGGFGEIFLLCAVLSCSAVRLFSSAKTKKSASVSLVYRGREYAFDGLCDSGCSACDPITSLPAIIIGRSALGDIGDELDKAEDIRLRLIPIKTAAGEKLLRGFIPERVSVNGRECAAVIAYDGDERDFGGFSCIIPSGLI